MQGNYVRSNKIFYWVGYFDVDCFFVDYLLKLIEIKKI